MASPSVGSYLSCDQSGNLKVLLEAGERLDRELVRQAVLSPMSGLALLDGWNRWENIIRSRSRVFLRCPIFWGVNTGIRYGAAMVRVLCVPA